MVLEGWHLLGFVGNACCRHIMAVAGQTLSQRQLQHAWMEQLGKVALLLVRVQGFGLPKP